VPVEMLHTMIRVLDEERSLAFYRELGFEERRRARVGKDTATIIMLGIPGDANELELTLNDGREDPYHLGEGYGHIALRVDSLDEEIARLADAGIALDRGPYQAYPGGSRIAFVEDPDGYMIELIERGAERS